MMTAQVVGADNLTFLAPCELLDWDTSFWEISIARVRSTSLTPHSAIRIGHWAQEHGVRCLYFLGQADDAITAHTAKLHGYQLMDVRTTMICSFSNTLFPNHPGAENGAVHVRPFRDGDLPTLQLITHDCYQDTRFYLDRNFADARCRELYETWIARSSAGYADVVLVAEFGNVICGFISCHFDPLTGTGTIGLVGVSAQVRKQGVGRVLMQQALLWFRQRRTREIRVVTQGANIAAQRLYHRSGFQITDKAIWFHKWYPGA